MPTFCGLLAVVDGKHFVLRSPSRNSPATGSCRTTPAASSSTETASSNPGPATSGSSCLPARRETGKRQVWNRLNHSPRTLENLLTLSSCQNEQDSVTFFWQNFECLGSNGTTTASRRTGWACRVTARIVLDQRGASCFASWPRWFLSRNSEDCRKLPSSDEGRGCGAQRHGGGVIAVIPLLARSLPAVRTTPDAACGRAFPSSSKEGIFSAEFRDRRIVCGVGSLAARTISAFLRVLRSRLVDRFYDRRFP
jgi:hypothetical protein